MENDRQETILRGRVKGVIDVDDDVSLLVLEVSWQCNQLNRPEIRESLEADLQMLPVPAEAREKLRRSIEDRLIHHKEARSVEFPLPPDVARQYANLVGREVELPFAPRAVDIESFDRTKVRQTPVGAARH